MIAHSFVPVPIQKLSHAIGTLTLSIIDNTGTNVYGSTLFANTESAYCPLPGVPVELLKGNGEVMKTESASDGTFSFSITLGESAQVRIPPYNGFSFSATYYLIVGSLSQRRLGSKTTSDSPTQSPTAQNIKHHRPTRIPTVSLKKHEASNSPTLQHFSTPEMRHRFTFDHTLATNSEQIPDVVDDSSYAAIHNGVTISNSRASFAKTTNPAAQPFLSLSPGLFGVADTISIEMWVSVDSATLDSAVLFSFGDTSSPATSISLNAKGFQGYTNTYLAIVVDPAHGLTHIYVNGTLSSTRNIPSTPLFNGSGSTETFNYLGWNAQKTTPGFIGAIDEVRLWDGALSELNITETFALGVDPTLLSFTANQTVYNIQINYLVTSEVVVNVGFYGGLSRNRMFGSESSFHIQALDPQCNFNTTVTIDPFYSEASILLPAMNYSVTLLPLTKHLPAPIFTYPTCSSSMSPYNYLEAAGELSVSIHTDLLISYNLYATFVYHTGLCMSIAGGESFATFEPAPDKFGRVCYSRDSTMLNRGQLWPLNITLFELYPAYTGLDPAWESVKLSMDLSIGTAVQDFVVLDSIVEITDVVSGFNSPSYHTYSDVHYSWPVNGVVPAPPCLNYTIVAGIPLPTAPFALPITVQATRYGPEGDASVKFKAFIPILGTIPSEVPNFYPVSTDPTLIFMILRDPPGGNSQTTIQAGTIFSTGISIDGMQTFHKSSSTILGGHFGADFAQTFIAAPLGVGVTIDTKDQFHAFAHGQVGMTGPQVSATRASESSYLYSFTFNYDFSTSSDPYIAGHPSDVIIGGGVDLIVSEALEGTCLAPAFIKYFSSLVYVNYSTPQTLCLDEQLILNWHPASISTFALPAIEIEILIDKLTTLLGGKQSEENLLKLYKQISNWKTVLSNYREHNSYTVSMFSASTRQFIDVVTAFGKFQTGQYSIDDFQNALGSADLDGQYVLPGSYSITVDAYINDLNSAFFDVSQSCDQVLPYTDANSEAENYLKNICNDFSSKTWRDFASMVVGSCTLSENGESANPLSAVPLFNRLCAVEAVSGSDVPGGLQSSSNNESLTQFLSDSKTLLTFGANSPVSLSWTTDITETRTFSVGYDAQYDLSIDGGIDAGGGGASFVFEGSTDIGLDQTFEISLGKTSNEIHDAQLIVTLTLDDSDSGDFFAVKITEDSVYGTPVFTTMGGASKCPGETGTSRRESSVRILEIRERCGADKSSSCDELTLGSGDNANFGVVIENLSPTQDEAYYTLKLGTSFDDYYKSGGDGNYTCGVPGQCSGLVVVFSNTDIQRIPYNRLVEVPFTVTRVYNGPVSLCNEFNDIEVMLIATCEIPSSSSYVYQYGVEYNTTTKQTTVMYDQAHRIYASNSTAFFSVKWPSGRRLESYSKVGLSSADGSDSADAMTDILLHEIRNYGKAIDIKIESLAQRIALLQNWFAFIVAIVTLVAMLAGAMMCYLFSGKFKGTMM